jgi:hypothetical protein
MAARDIIMGDNMDKEQNEKEAICLKTSLVLFESDKFASLKSRETGYSVKRRGAVPEMTSDKEALMDTDLDFIIGVKVSEDDRVKSLVNIRTALLAEFDAIAQTYLPPNDVKKYDDAVTCANEEMTEAFRNKGIKIEAFKIATKK